MERVVCRDQSRNKNKEGNKRRKGGINVIVKVWRGRKEEWKLIGTYSTYRYI